MLLKSSYATLLKLFKYTSIDDMFKDMIILIDSRTSLAFEFELLLLSYPLFMNLSRDYRIFAYLFYPYI